jgi:hypothetical protein
MHNGAMRLPLAACACAAIAACGGSSDPAAPDGAPVDSALVDSAPPVDTRSVTDAAPVCPGSGDAGVAFDPAAGFAMPGAYTRAYLEMQGQWLDQGEADWSCLGSSDDAVATTVAVTVAGTLEDYQTGNIIPNATVSAFADGDTGGTPTDTATTGSGGDYSLTLPSGTLRPTIVIEGSGIMDTHHLAVRLLPSAPNQELGLEAISNLTADALPAFIGETRTPGLGLGVWTLVDCKGHRVANAVATVSARSGCVAPLAGSTAYYFSAGATSLPVRHSQAATTQEDGRFMIMDMPVQSEAYVQVWGYISTQTPGTTPVTLLAELPFSVIGDAFVTGELRPRRAP